MHTNERVFSCLLQVWQELNDAIDLKKHLLSSGVIRHLVWLLKLLASLSQTHI